MARHSHTLPAHWQHSDFCSKRQEAPPISAACKVVSRIQFSDLFFSDFQNFDDVLFRQTLRSELEDVSKSLLMCFTCAPSGWGELLNLLRLKKRYLLDIGIKSNYIIWYLVGYFRV